MLNQLPPRERQIVNLLYERGEMAVADICESLPDQPSGSAVRTMLKGSCCSRSRTAVRHEGACRVAGASHRPSAALPPRARNSRRGTVEGITSPA